MVSIHVSLTVRNPTDIENAAWLLAEHARLSRAEPGCLRFEVFRSNLDAHAFFIIEAWESQAALDVHREATAFRTIYAPQVIPLVERAAHPVTAIE